MSKYQTINHQQLELLEREVSAKQPAKRVNIGVACLSRPEVCRRLVETESHMALCFFFSH
ncbi:hypothetical protein [Anoxybacillus kestanbolensis]|uniref:hypothetical protein n=1 Tax=Anoxybacillus kestanbolensis TaxID=227476 RepID=UPI003D1B768C